MTLLVERKFDLCRYSKYKKLLHKNMADLSTIETEFKFARRIHQFCETLFYKKYVGVFTKDVA